MDFVHLYKRGQHLCTPPRKAEKLKEGSCGATMGPDDDLKRPYQYGASDRWAEVFLFNSPRAIMFHNHPDLLASR